MPSAIAAQLHTLRAFTQTPADIAKTIKRVKNIGYDAVQTAAMAEISPQELRKILDGEGVECCGTHEPFDAMRDHPEAIIQKHQVLGAPYTAIGSPPASYRTEAGYQAFAREAGEVAAKLKAAGITWAYHNHSFELERYGKRTGLDILLESSDPQLFNFEIDTYWIQHGGGDPAAWIRRLKNRVPLVHLKDMVVGEDVTAARGLMRNEGESEEHFIARQEVVKAKRPIMAEVGEGNLNWPAILQACREAGVVWYIVEQDICQRDPFESLAISLHNLRGMGLT